MSIADLTHAEYIFLAYGVTFVVLALVVVQSWQSFRAARCALQDAGLASDKKAPE
ncbi:MAG: heme exporter protein CcmD [Alphaproteobacteria bacterium]|nr:heme exporter protein CcmD [Alphaproteobacteria bacterium]